MLTIGCHVSIAGGLTNAPERAERIGCSTLQLFCGSPRQWQLRTHSESEIHSFATALTTGGFSSASVHACYLVNPATDNQELHKQTVDRLVSELIISSRCGIDYYIVHPGSKKGQAVDKGLKNAADTLVEAAVNARSITGDVPTILLENTAASSGAGGNFSTLGQLRDRIKSLDPATAVGFVIDTCHAHAAGYDLTDDYGVETLHRDAQDVLGLDNIKMIHANDSVFTSGSGRDRHEHIGKGTIGRKGFQKFFTISDLAHRPVILETPWVDEATDKENIARIQRILREIDRE